MEPLTTTTAMVTTVVGYLAKKLESNKQFQSFTSDFSDAVVKWIKPLFLRKDETPRDVLANFQEKPNDEKCQNEVKALIEQELKVNEDRLLLLREMVDTIESKKTNDEQILIHIKDSEKFVINSRISGDVVFGDKDTSNENKKTN